MRSARDVLLAWAKSGGFAALHNGTATNEAIVDDLLTFLEKENRGIAVLREAREAERHGPHPIDLQALGIQIGLAP
jgi:hypothetical protein